MRFEIPTGCLIVGIIVLIVIAVMAYNFFALLQGGFGEVR